MKVARVALAVLLVGAAAWFGQERWLSPWLALAVGGLVAAGSWSGVALGALALGVGSLTLAAPEWTTLGGVGLMAGGLALGLLALEVEQRAPWALTHGAVRSGAWIAGGLLALTALPDARLLLLDAAGAPLELTARLQDPAARVAGLVHLPAVMESDVPGRWVLIFAGALALLAVFVLIRRQVTEPDQEERWGWRLLGLAGALIAVGGAMGLAQLLSSSVTIPGPEAWALSLSKAGQGTAVTGVEVASDARLGLASRPLVDLLRLACGALVLGWTLGPWRHRRVERIIGPRPGLLLACACACVAALLISHSVSWTLVGGAVVLFFSVLIAQRVPAASRLGEELAALVLLGWLVGWLSPAWTGAFA